MRMWLVSLALLTCLAPAAFAGGPHARLEGPGPDGVTYTARMISSDPSDGFEPWALAEGVVDGKRRSVLLRVEPTGEHGVYTLQRRWPADGRWMIRFNLGHPPAPATVVTLRKDGSIEKSRLYWKTDGAPECGRALRSFMPPGSDEDC